MNFVLGRSRTGCSTWARFASSCPSRCVAGCGRRKAPSWPDCGRSTFRTPASRTRWPDGARGRRDHRAARARNLRTSRSPGSRRPRSASGRSTRGCLRRAARPRSDAAPGRSLTTAVDLTDVQLFDLESGDSIIGDWGPGVVEGEHAGWRSLSLGRALRVGVARQGCGDRRAGRRQERGRRSVPCAAGLAPPGSAPRDGSDGHEFLENCGPAWQELFPSAGDQIRIAAGRSSAARSRRFLGLRAAWGSSCRVPRSTAGARRSGSSG